MQPCFTSSVFLPPSCREPKFCGFCFLLSTAFHKRYLFLPSAPALLWPGHRRPGNCLREVLACLCVRVQALSPGSSAFSPLWFEDRFAMLVLSRRPDEMIVLPT